MIHGDGTLANAIRKNLDCPDWLEWAAWDTPIFSDGAPDYVSVDHEILTLCNRLPAGQTVIVSSQVHVGSCARLERWFPLLRFAIVPENVRAISAVQDWAHQDRILFGCREPRPDVVRILSRWSDRIVHVSPESAEFTKHALNGFLALSVQYAQEIGELAEKVGADPMHVAVGLLSDSRIGAKAYLKPVGDPGPHLCREVHTLHFLGGGPLIDRLYNTIR